MKKRYTVIAGLPALVMMALLVTACEGPAGPAGPQGPKGDKGDAGDPGAEQGGLQSITIASSPTRTTYTVGDAFNSAGLVVTGTYDDDSIVTVTSGYTVTWDTDNKPLATGNTAITETAGSKTATVTWQGKSEDFSVSVNEPNAPTEVFNVATWDSALAGISAADDGSAAEWKEYGIKVTENFSVPGSTSPRFTGSYKRVTLTGNGTVSLNSQGNLFRLGSNQTLVIDSEDLTLQGLKNGQDYAGGTADQDNNASVILWSSSSSTLVLRNGTISGNSNGGVYGNYGTFNMSGGKISGNDNCGVFVNDVAFTMSGGEISGNTAPYGSGGVFVNDGAFIMSDGKISGNTGGVGIDNGNTFSMSGGEISGNTAGGVAVGNGSTFSMSGGEIKGNTAFRSGGVYVYSRGTFAKTGGGIIYGYNSSDPSNPLWNKANQGDTWGHAVFYNIDDSNQYYRDTTLAAGDNISTDNVPATGTSDNWTKKP